MITLIAISGVHAADSTISSGFYSSNGFSSTSTTSTNYNLGFNSYYSASDIQTYWPILGNQDNCLARQDLLLQIAPAGCQPTVVRSDILAEQNVPVFCQIDALTLNPLINIKEIKNIGFSGNYPSSVAGTGFHPAQAALRTRDTLLGSPLINNVGYAVVILRRNQNESSLPDEVRLNLTGIVDYDIQNAIGVGQAEFVMEPTSDTTWADSAVRNKNSFWQGRFFLRLVDVDENYANVAIYSGNSMVSSVKVKRGEISREIYLPGFYCKAALQVSYDGLIEQQTKATIEVGNDEGTDVLQLYKGSNFLNGKCTVRDIIPDKIRPDVGNVSISCNGQRIDLLLKIPGNGLFEIFRDKNNQSIKPQIEENNPTYGKVYYVDLATKGKYGLTSDNKLIKYDDVAYPDGYGEITDLVKSSTADLNLTKLKSALTEYVSLVAEKGLDATNNLIDQVYSPDKEKTFSDAITSYEKVADDYSAEKSQLEGGYSFGEKALQFGIQLSKSYNKWQTEARLIQKYLKLYPNGASATSYKDELNKYNTVDPTNSANVVYIDNKYRTLRLLSIDEPAKKAGVGFSWGSRALTVNKGESAEFPDAGNITLDSIIDTSSVKITSRCLQDTTTKDSKGTTQTTKKTVTTSLTLKVDVTQNVCGQVLKIDRINLETVAKIRLTPSVKGPRTETNLTVVIGIEKRAIQLTPEETQSRITELNKSIDRFDKISNSLGQVVSGLKAACFATAGILTIKNFVTGMNGAGLARQQVMRGTGGWNDQCNQMITAGKYQTLTQCFNANSAQIEQTVADRAKAITQVNGVLKGFEDAHTQTGNGLFGGSYVEREPVVADYRKYLLSNYGDRVITDPNTNKEIKVSELLKNENGYKNGEYGYEQLRDLQLNLELQQSSNSVTKNISQNDGWTIASQIKDNQDLVTATLNSDKLKKDGFGSAISLSQRYSSTKAANVVAVDDKMRAKYFPDDVGVNKIKYATLSVGEASKDFGSAAPYALGLEKSSTGNSYGVISVSKLTTDSTGSYVKDSTAIDTGKFASTYQISSVTSAADVSCVNKYKNPKISYYSNDPYKGMPALVPFDINRGWYVATKPVIAGFGNTATYQSSGQVTSFYLCNVGANGMEQFLEGSRDDICQLVNLNTGQSLSQFSCISDETQAKKLIADATTALQQAAEQKDNSLVSINVGGRGSISMKPQGTTSTPSTQCQDTMSPGDCKTLFNVCDPVICPASRCNFGGQYQVADVIQSGVVGSLLLCLPNIKEGIMLPVCLTGIKSGLDAYISLLKGHRDCLQESLNTSQMLGVCDEIYSIYTCEFFWSQVAPVANVLLPKLLELGSGTSGARGGGEYQNIAGAWSNAQKSVDYFTRTYAVNSMNAFKIRSIQDAGTTFCKAYISGVGPNTFETLIEPDSPSQFYARFDAFKFSDATVPATSQYKVFYHIFSGNDQGVYYSVYLKDPPQTSYYYSATRVFVASGFIAKGQYKSETKDFTAPEGYKNLCVRINDKESCGFKEVSTDAAINYITDTLAANEINQSGITSQSQCISGSANVGSLLNPNIQAGADQMVNPAVYNNGIIRVCATQNPGKSTDPTRYSDVGFCDDQTMRCWLDKRSVTNAIGSADVGLINSTLQGIASNQIASLQASGDLLSDNDSISELNNLEDAKNTLKNSYDENTALLLVQRIESTIIKLYRNDQKAWAYLIRAEVKGEIAKNKLNQATVTTTPTSTTTLNPITPTATNIFGLTKADTDSKRFILLNGKLTDLYLKTGSTVYVSGFEEKAIGTLRSDNTLTLSQGLFESLVGDMLSDTITSVGGQDNYNLLTGNGVKITVLNMDIPGQTTTSTTPSTTTPGTTQTTPPVATTTTPATATYTLTLKDVNGVTTLFVNNKQTIVSFDDLAGMINADLDNEYLEIGSKSGNTYTLDQKLLADLTANQLTALKASLGDKVYTDLRDNEFTVTANTVTIKSSPALP